MTLITEFGQMDADHITEMVAEQVADYSLAERIDVLDGVVANLMYMCARLKEQKEVKDGTNNQESAGHADHIAGGKSAGRVRNDHVRLPVSSPFQRSSASGSADDADRARVGAADPVRVGASG